MKQLAIARIRALLGTAFGAAELPDGRLAVADELNQRVQLF